MLNPKVQHNAIAVTTHVETALNVEHAFTGGSGVSMLASQTDFLQVDRVREVNDDEVTGLEEADTIYDRGALASGSLTFPRMQAQHAVFVLSNALGACVSAADGAAEGYKHTITPLANEYEASRSLPTFTAMMRYGKTLDYKRFASMAIDSFVMGINPNSWITLNAVLKGTGKFSNTIYEETLSAAGNAATITLAAYGVEGSDAATRLDNVHAIRVETVAGNGIWQDVAYTAVSGATPAVITITSTGLPVTATNFKVLYAPAYSVYAAWAAMPARVVETPLIISNVTFTLGGSWSGSAFTGGKTVTRGFNGLTWNFQNNLRFDFLPNSLNSGAVYPYAGGMIRDGRLQTLSFNKEFRDYILQNYMTQNETFGVHVKAVGALYGATQKYTVDIVFPKCGVVQAPIQANGKRLAEAGDLRVLEDSTNGSVWCEVQNLQASYLTV